MYTAVIAILSCSIPLTSLILGPDFPTSGPGHLMWMMMLFNQSDKDIVQQVLALLLSMFSVSLYVTDMNSITKLFALSI